MGWRNAQTSLVLNGQVNAKWPFRDKGSDGTIGDAAHATRDSDHNPWVIVDGQGVVRARDIDKDGVDIGWMFEELRKLGAQGDPRLSGGGYLIWNRRITTPDFTKWVPYNGSNPHDKHGHVSFSRNRAGFDSTAPYAFFVPGGVQLPPAAGVQIPPSGAIIEGDRMAQEGESGSDVAWIQTRLNIQGHSVNVDSKFGPQTTAAVKQVQAFFGLTVDGVVGAKTRSVLELTPAPAGRPVLRRGSKDVAAVKIVQDRLRLRYPSYRHEHGELKVDGDFGKTTEAWVRELQGRVGLKVDGVVGAATYKAMGL